MAKITFDDASARDKLDALEKRIRFARLIATERGARMLQDEFRNNVPVRTGRLRDAIIRRERRAGPLKGRWEVRILASRFPARFFYAIMLFPLYRIIIRRVSPRIRAAMKNRFLLALDSVLGR